jgi:hypothetical protein
MFKSLKILQKNVPTAMLVDVNTGTLAWSLVRVPCVCACVLCYHTPHARTEHAWVDVQRRRGARAR